MIGLSKVASELSLIGFKHILINPNELIYMDSRSIKFIDFIDNHEILKTGYCGTFFGIVKCWISSNIDLNHIKISNKENVSPKENSDWSLQQFNLLGDELTKKIEKLKVFW